MIKDVSPPKAPIELYAQICAYDARQALNLGQARDWARAAREAGQLLLRLADGLEGYARRLEAEGKAEEKAGAVAKGEGEARAAPAPAGPLTAEY